MTSKPRKNAHKALLRDVSRLINQPVDSLATRFVALAKLKLDATEAQLLAGDPSVTVADLRALEEILSAHVPRPGLQVVVKFAEPADAAEVDSGAIDGVASCRRCSWTPAGADRWPECPKCGWRSGLDVSGPWEPVNAPAPTSSPEPLPAATTSPPNVVSLDEQRADRSAELRIAARATGGYAPPVQAPRVNNPGNESPAALSRRISESYR
jgi:hypothetical protein